MLTLSRRILQQPSCTCLSALRQPRNFFSSDKTDDDRQQFYKWRKPWSQMDGYQGSKFSLFISGKGSNKFMKMMQKKYDFTPSGIQRWLREKVSETENFKQRYIPERHQILGPDLATAHFVVFRGGSVRFEGGKIWVKKNEDDEYDLPAKRVPDMKLEAIDASNLNLMYVGLDNFVHLEKLKWLSLAGNRMVDDWFLDKLSGELSHLEHLDLSGCKNITHKGIAILARLTKLKVLNVHNTIDNVEFRLACLSLEELKPTLEVKGINYEEPINNDKPLEQVQ